MKKMSLAITRRVPVDKKNPPIRDAVHHELYESIAEILRTARTKAYRAVNFAMVEAYWNVGRMIVEEEQHGKERAEYGAFLIRNLSSRLMEEFGKGFNEANLRNFRQFFICFPIRNVLRTESPKIHKNEPLPDNPESIRYALRSELTWTHYRLLMRVEKTEARAWYMKEAADQNWSTRALERQINSLYYERLWMSRDKAPVETEALGNTLALAAKPEDFVKNPYVLEFQNITDKGSFRESELEQAIIGNLLSGQ